MLVPTPFSGKLCFCTPKRVTRQFQFSKTQPLLHICLIMLVYGLILDCLPRAYNVHGERYSFKIWGSNL